MTINSGQIIKKLKDDGFKHVSTKGDHNKFKHENGRIVIVPHPKKDLPIGTGIFTGKPIGNGDNMKKQYPVLVHKEDATAYGVTIPDIPGCFTAGGTIEEAVANVQEAIECYFEGENVTELPVASKVENLLKDKDLYTEGGFWVLVEVDFSFLSKKTVRINVTVPEFKLALIDRAAKKRNLTRSAFLVQAAESKFEANPTQA